MEMGSLDLVGVLADRGCGWERAALELQLDGSVSELAGLLESVDPGTLEPGELVGYLRVTERVTAQVAAIAQRTVALVADRTEALGLHPQDARHELGAALRLSPVTASRRVRVALDLRDRFPATLALMDTGRVGHAHAAHLVRETEGLPDEVAAAVEARVLPVMARQTPAETRRAVRDAVVRVDPHAAADRAQKAHEQRRIERVPDRDGRTGWYLPLPADVEIEMWGATTAAAKTVRAARRAAGLDHVALDALRVDLVIDRILGLDPTLRTTAPTDPSIDTEVVDSRPVDDAADDQGDSDSDDDEGDGEDSEHDEENADENAVDLRVLLALLSQGPATTAGRRLPRCTCGGAQTAAVVLDMPTALGLADNPGHLPGYGAIPAELARRMAGDRDWVRWLTEPVSGQLLDRGARRYRPSGPLAAYVNARDQVCGFPGCGSPAHTCDCDHIVAYRDGRHGGQTVRRNLGPLCRQHHNAKTHGRWHLHYDPTSRTKTWTSPLGLTHLKHATPLLT